MRSGRLYSSARTGRPSACQDQVADELDMGSVMGQLMTFVPKPNASLGQDWTVRDMSETVERKDEK
jgi:hypothetical protein